MGWEVALCLLSRSHSISTWASFPYESVETVLLYNYQASSVWLCNYLLAVLPDLTALKLVGLFFLS